MVRADYRPPAPALKLSVEPDRPSPRAIARAASVLRKGGLVAFPTDTLYALGADASNAFALQRVFAVKGRGQANPIPLLVADLAMATQVIGDLPEPAVRLAERYWPGPLTLLLPAPRGISNLLTADTGRIGLRVPDSRVAQALILRFGGPVTGTSANRSGDDDPRNADEVVRQLGGCIDLILDGGPVLVGSPSTVVDVSVSPPVIVRQGAVQEEEIFRLLALPSPSRNARHRGGEIPKPFGKPRKI
jgi:L-threonylcarbamoyladenylate synthase